MVAVRHVAPNHRLEPEAEDRAPKLAFLPHKAAGDEGDFRATRLAPKLAFLAHKPAGDEGDFRATRLAAKLAFLPDKPAGDEGDFRATRLAPKLAFLPHKAAGDGRWPAETWKVSIPPNGTIALSADEIFGYRRRPDEVCLSTWLLDRTTVPATVKQDESIRFRP